MKISTWKVIAIAFILIMGPEILALGLEDAIQNLASLDPDDTLPLAKLLSFFCWLPAAYLVFRKVVGTGEHRASGARSFYWFVPSILLGFVFLLLFNLWELGLAPEEIDALNERVARFRDDFRALIPLSAIASMVVMNMVVPIFEEVVFRGILSGYLSERYGLTAGFLVSAALFAGVHPSRFALNLLFGLCSSALFHRSGNLVASATFHITYNSLITIGALWW